MHKARYTTAQPINRSPSKQRKLRVCLALCLFALVGCGGSDPGSRLSSDARVRSYVHDRSGGAPGVDLENIQFKSSLCQPGELTPSYERLDEQALVAFLERQGIQTRVERPRADLAYVTLLNAGTDAPVRLRVAILPNASQAGHELYEALLQHGAGSWGVHRSNLGVLGPAGSTADAIAFAGKTRLACWGVFTIAGREDAYVIPGGYAEL